MEQAVSTVGGGVMYGKVIRKKRTVRKVSSIYNRAICSVYLKPQRVIAVDLGKDGWLGA